MNMFQKFGLKTGLLEQVSSGEIPTVSDVETEYPTFDPDPLPEAEHIETVNLTSLVQDVYDANHLTDLSRSIFKARDVINTLPAEMTTDTKRSSVVGILSSFGLTVDDVVSDGNARISALQSNNVKISEENASEVASKNATIEDLKHQIEMLSKEIAHLEATTAQSGDLISAEIKEIQSLIDFILGGK